MRMRDVLVHVLWGEKFVEDRINVCRQFCQIRSLVQLVVHPYLSLAQCLVMILCCPSLTIPLLPKERPAKDSIVYQQSLF